MNFLGYTAEQFFSLPQEDPPFGKGPWPCLNPTCEFFRQLVIPKYHLITCHEGRPRANFACVCGFTYSRIGPDQTVEDMYRWSRVWTYGPIWEGTLRRGWQDDTLSFRQLVRQLHIHETTLPHYAASLGLSYPRPGGGPILPDVEGKRKRWNTVEQMIAKRDTTRTALIAALEEHPEWGREDLQKKMPGVYKWLLIHDSEWLQRYGHGRVPAIRKGGLVSREYWQQRDSNLAEEVKASAQHLRAAPGRPFRITRQAIAAEIHQVGLLAHQLDKLPLTSKVLAEVAETREAAAIRRLQWVAERYRQEEKHPNRWQLIQQAGADNLISQPLVKEEVEKLLFMLNS